MPTRKRFMFIALVLEEVEEAVRYASVSFVSHSVLTVSRKKLPSTSNTLPRRLWMVTERYTAAAVGRISQFKHITSTRKIIPDAKGLRFITPALSNRLTHAPTSHTTSPNWRRKEWIGGTRGWWRYQPSAIIPESRKFFRPRAMWDEQSEPLTISYDGLYDWNSQGMALEG